MADVYPIALDLRGRRCLVIGGGRVARRKVEALLECGAEVTVIAPEAVQPLRELAGQKRLTWQQRPYRTGDLEGAFLVIGATNDESANRAVAQEARAGRALVNIVDAPELCDFFLPAVARRGRIAVAVSTGGASPALAKRLRQKFEAILGEEYGELAELLHRLRQEAAPRASKGRQAAGAWQAVLDSDVLELLAAGKREEAEARARECLRSSRSE
jgi:precorrin-2 dehydrogenase/sirohydrochlorin ferrochelatase